MSQSSGQQDDSGCFKVAIYVLLYLGYCFLIGSLLVWISAQARGIQEYLGTAMHVLGTWWWGSPRYLPWFVFVLIFLALRVLLAPSLLTHRRIGRGQDRQQKQTWDESENRSLGRYLIIAVFEGLLLVFLARGVEGSAIGWSADQFVLAIRHLALAGDPARAAAGVLAFLGVDAVIRAIVLGVVHNLFEREIYPLEDKDRLYGTLFIAFVFAEMLIYAPVFYILLLSQATNPYLCTLLLSFLCVRAFTTWGYAFLSIRADERTQLAS